MQIFHPQQPLLKPYVKQAYYYTIRPGNLNSVTIVPTGNLFLALLWGGEEYFIQRPDILQREISGSIIISGQQLEVGHIFVNEKEVNIIVFELSPIAILQFFGNPQLEMTGQVLKLEDLCYQKAHQLFQQVIAESNPAEQIAIIEQFLYQKLIFKQWKEHTSITEAIDIIKQTNGKVSISVLATSLRISTRRSLERRFLEAVGIPPKAYCKVVQFNNTFRQLVFSRKHFLDVVSEAGYYDQPHFINHFRKVFGVSPGQFFDEYEKFLYSFKKDNDHCAIDSMSDTLQGAGKLYVF